MRILDTMLYQCFVDWQEYSPAGVFPLSCSWVAQGGLDNCDFIVGKRMVAKSVFVVALLHLATLLDS